MNYDKILIDCMISHQWGWDWFEGNCRYRPFLVTHDRKTVAYPITVNELEELDELVEEAIASTALGVEQVLLHIDGQFTEDIVKQVRSWKLRSQRFPIIQISWACDHASIIWQNLQIASIDQKLKKQFRAKMNRLMSNAASEKPQLEMQTG